MNDIVNLDALLKSKTFQGMSDIEIQAIIDYRLKVQAETLRAEFETRMAEYDHSDLYDATLAASERASEAFERALNLNVNYASIAKGA